MLTPASAAERVLIEGLMQLYTYDFSELEPPGSAAFDVDPAVTLGVGGQIDIVGRPDQGTSVVAWVPMKEAA